MNTPPNSFPKSQRLCSRYLIDRLFEPGNSSSFSAYPLRVVYQLYPAESDGSDATSAVMPQMLVSVPKRQFKHAVDRNHVKRQVREAYRTNIRMLDIPEGKSMTIAFIWLDSKHHPFAVVNHKVQNIIMRISEAIHRS